MNFLTEFLLMMARPPKKNVYVCKKDFNGLQTFLQKKTNMVCKIKKGSCMATKWLCHMFRLNLLLSCVACDIKGAYNPHSYAPSTPYTIWCPSIKPTTTDIKEEDYPCSKDFPLTLQKLIDIALIKNPDTKKSWALTRASAAQYGKSLKDQFVLAEIYGSYSHTHPTHTKMEGPYQTEYRGGLELTYRIIDCGQARMSSKSALYSLFYANWSHNSQMQKTIQMTMTKYYNYLYQKHLLIAAKQDVANAKLSLEATQEKLQQGIATLSDTIQAQTSYFQKKLNIINQKQNLHDSYTQLINTIGLPSNKVLYFEDYPEKTELINIDTLDMLIMKAKQNRPDLLAYESSLQSSKAALQAESLKKFPIIIGKCDIGRGNQQKTYNISTQIQLSFPLFQGFYIDNSIKEARAKLESAEASFKQIQLSITQEVSNCRSDAIYAQKSIKYAQAYLGSAEKEYKIHLARYKTGTGTIIELINAQTAIADARVKLAQAQNYWYRSIVNLDYATGTLVPFNKKNSQF